MAFSTQVRCYKMRCQRDVTRSICPKDVPQTRPPQAGSKKMTEFRSEHLAGTLPFASGCTPNTGSTFHRLQFYVDDESLVEQAARFLEMALREG